MEKLQIKTVYGLIEGYKEEESYLFKGIPYAKPPVGERRFTAPEKPDKWEGVFEAKHYGNRCPQGIWDSPDNIYMKEFYSEPVYATPLSEDCLYLNVQVPLEKPEDGQKYPVLFYIHGGGFSGGCSHEMEFRGDGYARRGIITVTINYRLGSFGFFAHPLLAAEDKKAVGNYGLLDQIAALDWVQENIEYFGGDKSNVTIAGQSAGGMSVRTLLSTDYAKGKFAHAIIQSAGGYPSPVQRKITLEEAYELGERLMEYAGVESLAELRQVPWETLLAAQDKIGALTMERGLGLPYGPVVNEDFLAAGLDEILEQAKMTKVPLLIGTNRDDMCVTKEEAENCSGIFKESCKNLSFMLEEQGQEPAYVYYFKRRLPGDESGAFHSAELWYTFGTLGQCWRPMTEADSALSEEMMDYWESFIRNGVPAKEGRREWKPCRKADGFVMEFDV